MIKRIRTKEEFKLFKDRVRVNSGSFNDEVDCINCPLDGSGFCSFFHSIYCPNKDDVRKYYYLTPKGNKIC